jgi:hypothetical protein
MTSVGCRGGDLCAFRISCLLWIWRLASQPLEVPPTVRNESIPCPPYGENPSLSENQAFQPPQTSAFTFMSRPIRGRQARASRAAASPSKRPRTSVDTAAEPHHTREPRPLGNTTSPQAEDIATASQHTLEPQPPGTETSPRMRTWHSLRGGKIANRATRHPERPSLVEEVGHLTRRTSKTSREPKRKAVVLRELPHVVQDRHACREWIITRSSSLSVSGTCRNSAVAPVDLIPRAIPLARV